MRTQAVKESQARYYQRNKEAAALRNAARSVESALITVRVTFKETYM